MFFGLDAASRGCTGVQDVKGYEEHQLLSGNILVPPLSSCLPYTFHLATTLSLL